MENINYKLFISGHRDLTQDEFNDIYIPPILKYIEWLNEDHSHIFDKKSLTFYIGDCSGCDEMAIQYITDNILPKYDNIYLIICCCSFEFEGKKEYKFDNKNISIINSFDSHEERDTYMTLNTDADLLYIRPGKWDSGTAQNFVKRVWMPKPVPLN